MNSNFKFINLIFNEYFGLDFVSFLSLPRCNFIMFKAKKEAEEVKSKMHHLVWKSHGDSCAVRPSYERCNK